MSGWIRQGDDDEWHLVSLLETADAMERGEYRLKCGGSVATRLGWQERVPELVPIEDRHAPCRARAERELYWWDRMRKAPVQPSNSTVRDLALEVAPDLAEVQVVMDPRRGGAQRVRLIARNLDVMLEGSAPAMNEAIGELLAHLELDVRPAGGS